MIESRRDGIFFKEVRVILKYGMLLFVEIAWEIIEEWLYDILFLAE